MGHIKAGAGYGSLTELLIHAYRREVGAIMITTILIVAAVLACSMPALRWMRRRGLARHRADWGSGWLNTLDGWVRIFCRRYHRVNSATLDLPERGGAIVVANHVSGLDPLLVVAASLRPVRFLIAREQYERFGLRWLFRAVGCIPVDRGQRPERALREALRALQHGEVVVLFPHGGIHVHDTPALLKGGVVKLAHKSHCLIYPLHIDGVRGVGHTLLAVLLRSQARLRVFPPLSCVHVEHRECLQRISRVLHKKLWGNENQT